MSRKTFIIDGTRFSSLEEFARYFSNLVLRDHEWQGDLNAFNDILRGGFGTPQEGFTLRWEHSELSRERLGHAETIRWLSEAMQACTPDTARHLTQCIQDLRDGRGETIFDSLVDIIRTHGPGGDEADDGVDLELV